MKIWYDSTDNSCTEEEARYTSIYGMVSVNNGPDQARPGKTCPFYGLTPRNDIPGISATVVVL
jgi:hypothetical protein